MKNNFNKNGFVILRSFFSLEYLYDFEETLYYLYKIQAEKIGINYPHTGPLYNIISHIITQLEDGNIDALRQIQRCFPEHPILRKMIGPLGEILSTYLDSDIRTNLVHGPSLFINRPGSDRLLYKWHSEQHYYPKRRTFLNMWWPLFKDKTRENGTMSFKVGSHLRQYPFAEYYGYDKKSQGNKDYFLQYEIPENFLKDFDEFHCEVKRGDLMVFHSNLVHRSNPNITDGYSFAGIARAWNPTNDLTINGSFATYPYTGTDKGCPGMVVKP